MFHVNERNDEKFSHLKKLMQKNMFLTQDEITRNKFKKTHQITKWLWRREISLGIWHWQNEFLGTAKDSRLHLSQQCVMTKGIHCISTLPFVCMFVLVASHFESSTALLCSTIFPQTEDPSTSAFPVVWLQAILTAVTLFYMHLDTKTTWME